MLKTNSSTANVADKITTRLIAGAQLLLSLWALFEILIVGGYGGAALYPDLYAGLIAYSFYGIATAIWLNWGSVPARVSAFLWHVALVSYLLWQFLKPREQPASDSGLAMFVIIVSVASLIYLASSSLPKLKAAARANPTAAKILILGIFGFASLVVGYYFFFHATVTGLEMRLRASDSQTRCDAAQELGSKGRAAISALTTLKRMIENTLCGDDTLAAAIEQVGGVESVMEVMKTGGDFGRSNAAWYLRRTVLDYYPARQSEFKELFRQGLADPNDLGRQACIEALAGLRATDLLPEIDALSTDPSPQVRQAVTDAHALMTASAANRR